MKRCIFAAICLIGLSASTLSAQVVYERGWIDISGGIAQARTSTFQITDEWIVDFEEARSTVTYSVPRGIDFDFGGGYMFTPLIGIGVNFTGTAHSDLARIDAHIPHPYYTDFYGSAAAPTGTFYDRTEGTTHIQIMLVPQQTARLRTRIYAGPSVFRIRQDLVSDFRYRQQWGIFPAYNNVTITSIFTENQVEGAGIGFHVGGDLSVFFTRVVGVGGFARLSSGVVDLDDPFTGKVAKIDVGGFQAGGGLRLKF